MLIPQFSIRSMLLLTAGCAVVFSVVGLALRGHYWAAGVSIGVLSLVAAFVVYALFFALVWGAALVSSPPRRGTAGQLASSQPHPQPEPAESDDPPAGGNPFATQ